MWRANATARAQRVGADRAHLAQKKPSVPSQGPVAAREQTRNRNTEHNSSPDRPERSGYAPMMSASAECWKYCLPVGAGCPVSSSNCCRPRSRKRCRSCCSPAAGKGGEGGEEGGSGDVQAARRQPGSGGGGATRACFSWRARHIAACHACRTGNSFGLTNGTLVGLSSAACCLLFGSHPSRGRSQAPPARQSTCARSCPLSAGSPAEGPACCRQAGGEGREGRTGRWACCLRRHRMAPSGADSGTIHAHSVHVPAAEEVHPATGHAATPCLQ